MGLISRSRATSISRGLSSGEGLIIEVRDPVAKEGKKLDPDVEDKRAATQFLWFFWPQGTTHGRHSKRLRKLPTIKPPSTAALCRLGISAPI